MNIFSTVKTKAPGGDAERVSLVGIAANLLLTAFKLVAGLTAHSSAMVSDAVHSASDVLSGIIVIVGVRIAGKASDREHPYGHERYECVAAILLAVILAATGFSIAAGAFRALVAMPGTELVVPGLLALAAAVVSIVSKEGLFWYTRKAAERLDSPALMASAWDHRADALSSIGALLGIAGARMGFAVADPLASLVICVFIGKAALDIFRDAVDKMVDRACDETYEQALRSRALETEGVASVDLLQTRAFGSRLYVEMEISVDGELTLRRAHEIAEAVHDGIERDFPKVKHIMIHVNPAEKA